MKLEQILTPTKTATQGMSVRDFIAECTRANTPGLPFCTRSGRISGRVTMKHIFKTSCLPDYIVESARILLVLKEFWRIPLRRMLICRVS